MDQLSRTQSDIENEENNFTKEKAKKNLTTLKQHSLNLIERFAPPDGEQAEQTKLNLDKQVNKILVK